MLAWGCWFSMAGCALQISSPHALLCRTPSHLRFYCTLVVPAAYPSSEVLETPSLSRILQLDTWSEPAQMKVQCRLASSHHQRRHRGWIHSQSPNVEAAGNGSTPTSKLSRSAMTLRSFPIALEAAAITFLMINNGPLTSRSLQKTSQ